MCSILVSLYNLLYERFCERIYAVTATRTKIDFHLFTKIENNVQKIDLKKDKRPHEHSTWTQSGNDPTPNPQVDLSRLLKSTPRSNPYPPKTGSRATHILPEKTMSEMLESSRPNQFLSR